MEPGNMLRGLIHHPFQHHLPGVCFQRGLFLRAALELDGLDHDMTKKKLIEFTHSFRFDP